ncbi:hypothetical protein [Sorangium sp. So ce887]|uniref:hypothetical protein n=1 Tax=Sorangium sp. So ce887 TaxID=3133324 RepID=UPI003F6449AA
MPGPRDGGGASSACDAAKYDGRPREAAPSKGAAVRWDGCVAWALLVHRLGHDEPSVRAVHDLDADLA